MSGTPLQEAAASVTAFELADEPALAEVSVRYHALDAARGILMMLGVVVHTSNIYATTIRWKISDPPGSTFFDLLAMGIHVFRMPAFFWISGFFCGLTFQRLGAAGMLGRRAPRLAIPLLSAWILLNIPQAYVLARYQSLDPAAVIGAGVGIGHLWFLLDLLIYVGLAALVLPHLKAIRVPEWLARSAALQVAMLALATQAVVDVARLLPGEYEEPYGLTSIFRLATYLPYFAAGVLMYRLPLLRRGFLSARPWWLIPAVPISLMSATLSETQGRMLHEASSFVAIFASWVCVAAVLSLFHRMFARESRLTRFLADASYTVYLFHHIVVILLGIALLHSPLGMAAKFVLICTLTLAITMGLHMAVVSRVPLLRYLFNGKRPAPQGAAI